MSKYEDELIYKLGQENAQLRQENADLKAIIAFQNVAALENTKQMQRIMDKLHEIEECLTSKE
jgi:hypothetical protein